MTGINLHKNKKYFPTKPGMSLSSWKGLTSAGMVEGKEAPATGTGMGTGEEQEFCSYQ